jgi:ATPase subunit of ABC transporter with duplicated ATPase domains
VPAVWRIATVAQETPALAMPAIDYVLDGDAELRGIEHELAALEAAHDDDHDGHRVGELHARLSEVDGYSARSRAAALLSAWDNSRAAVRTMAHTAASSRADARAVTASRRGSRTSSTATAQGF